MKTCKKGLLHFFKKYKFHLNAYRSYIILLLITIVSLQSCRKPGGLPDLRETYQYKDSKPFGGKVAHALLSEVFPDKYININKKSFGVFRSETYIDSASFYFSLSKRFFCTQSDASSLMEFVSNGNTAFIAASYIDTTLSDKLNFSQAQSEWMVDVPGGFFTEGYTSVNDSFGYFYHPFFNYFSKTDSLTTKIIGRNQAGKPNLVVIFLGKGRLYLHCDPRSFSNYFLLKGNNFGYMKQVMQFTRQQSGNIFWDDYYNQKNYREDGKRNSALDILFQHPELTVAFWILLILLLFYILFNGKRKQRIIPVIKPVENTSIAFTEAIAGLYLTEKNNRTIADKMITYFNDHIRNRYFLNTHGSGKEFVQVLSKKSGVSFESVQALYNTIEQVQLTEDLSDFELLTLNEQIQNFYKNRN